MEKIKSVSARMGLGGGALVTLYGLGVLLAGPANAQTDPVGDAFTDLQTKITTYGAAIVALVVLSVGIFLGIKYLRKGAAKA